MVGRCLRVFFLSWLSIAIIYFIFLFGLLTVAYFHENPYTTEKLILGDGYPFEEHSVTTTDGYIVRIHRIPSDDPKGKKQVVMVQPGLLMDSACFVSNGKNGSLAYILSDAGYDVWLGNSRGTAYGREHRSINSDQSEFWNFSWEDLAAHEVPSIIDYILNDTGVDKLTYIGNSQSGLVALAMLSTNDSYNDKIGTFFGLAPAASLAHVKGPMIDAAPASHLLDMFEELMGPKPVLSRSILNDMLTIICSVGALQYSCERTFYRNGGTWSTQIEYDRLPIYYANYPSGSSTKNTRHFNQMMAKQRTARFDYGEVENMKRYGTLYPPSFNFSNVRVPMYIWYSEGDYLVGDQDIVDRLVPALRPEFVKKVISLNGYNHFDFHWGLRAPKDIYHPIVQFMDNQQTKRVSRETFCAKNDNNDICV